MELINHKIKIVRNICVGVFTLFVGITVAQDSLSVIKESTKLNSGSYKSILSANVFASTPLNVFKSTDFNNLNSGYAKTGYGAELAYGFKLYQAYNNKGALFVRGALSYMRNTVNSRKIAEQIKSMTTEQTNISDLYSSATATYWENYTVTGGFSYQSWFGKNKKIGIEPIVMVGSSYCNTPDIKYDVQIGYLSFETRNNSKGNWAFTHKEGVKLNYLLAKKTVLNFDISYFSAMANAKGMEHIVLGNKDYTRTFQDYKINVSAVLVGIGISTRF